MSKKYAPTQAAKVTIFLLLIPISLWLGWLCYEQLKGTDKFDSKFWFIEFPAIILVPLIPAFTYLRIVSVTITVELQRMEYRVLFWTHSFTLDRYEGPLLLRRGGRHKLEQSAFLFWRNDGRLISVWAGHFAQDEIAELRALFEKSGQMFKEKTYLAHPAIERVLSFGALVILIAAGWMAYAFEILSSSPIVRELAVVSLVIVVVASFLVDAFALSVRVKVYSGKVFYHSLFRSRALPTEDYERSTSTGLLFRDGGGRRVLLPIFMLSRKDRDEIVCKIREGTLAEQVGEVLEQKGSEGH